MDTWGAFLFFAVWCLFALIYVFVMVPETSGRSLENMSQLFEHRWFEMRRFAYQQDVDIIPSKESR
jgi:Sugar (and other) transporter